MNDTEHTHTQTQILICANYLVAPPCIRVVKIGIRIVGSYDPTIPHIEKETNRGRIAHPNRIGSRIGRIVRSYSDPTKHAIWVNLYYGLIRSTRA
jgi:hypothetical protein